MLIVRLFRGSLRPALVALMLVFFAAGSLRAAEPVDYARDIKPLLAANCVQCHGPDKQESDLRLDAGRSILAGGNSGPAVVPSHSDESLLIQAVEGEADVVSRMPPEDEAEPLAAEQIALLRRWIDAGAKFPEDDAPLAAKQRNVDHWSFQPIARPAPPPVTNRAWVASPIDAFVLAKLEAAQIQPSPAADRVTLIRRLSLDLIGLLPTPEEVQAFVADERPDAYERLVDRLLASPRYGERWGRLWLDQARYADSHGYTNDGPRSIWPYRDYVLHAFNRDLPFDQFTIEQLAGDLLPDATAEQIVATGFHRNTQINDEGGSDAEQYRVEAVVDRVSTTGIVFMGLTYGCARCHDHKFDPISQRNFYEMFAFFNSQDEPNYDAPLVAPNASKLPAQREEISRFAAALKALDAKADNAEQAKQELTARLDAAKKQEAAIRAREFASTMVLRERSQPRETYVHIRGEFLRKGKPVTTATPEFLPPLKPSDNSAGSVPTSRLDLARWLVADEHPLTPRVIANRQWQAFFGQGLVRTDNDFGLQGENPSHPELLDWLARSLLDHDWSLKALHREIVLSATYQQASTARPELEPIDTNNRLLARQNRLRLDAELIRDAALTAAGLLSTKMHGASVFPPQPAGVMQRTRNPGRKWNTSTGEDRYRRGLYTFFWRSTPHPFLKSFDAPDSNTACTRRERSNTPIQALTLLNDEAFVEASQMLALRLLRALPEGDDPARIDQLFRWCLCREPGSAERAAVEELVQAERQASQASKPELTFITAQQLPESVTAQEAVVWATVARAMLNLDEFMTRE
jgi:mono/diheme cytochrome c family protein